MDTDIIKILSNIFYDMGDTHKQIVSFYERENTDYINLEQFIKICEKNNIINNPNELLNFLDSVDIKLGILPMLNSPNEWTCRIYYDNNIIISGEYFSRKEATLIGIEKSFYLYHNKSLKTEKNGKNRI